MQTASPISLERLPVFNKENIPDQKADFTAGSIFLINKPPKWSSFRVVGFLRKMTGIKKIGHAGTLDPMATGLLILCTGKATKSISLIQDQQKEYRPKITFGSSTPSYDAETEADHTAPAVHITEELIKKQIAERFTGDIEQIAPMYSAVKHQGQRLYKLARKGLEVERQPRRVTVYGNTLIGYQPPELTVDIACSKGTYIRTLAHDLGLALNSRAHLSGLVRTGIGNYRHDTALDVTDLLHIFECDDSIDLSA
ncbi:MAG: tRNA pseudouridine(55) synthase TruB [Balneolales bacterium]